MKGKGNAIVIGKKKQTDSFELKKGSCPVNGMNSYSVFKNGVLVFMMDGDRASLFRPEEVEVIDIGGDMRLYRVSNWAFTGRVGLSVVLKRFLPKGCVICPAIDKVVGKL